MLLYLSIKTSILMIFILTSHLILNKVPHSKMGRLRYFFYSRVVFKKPG